MRRLRKEYQARHGDDALDGARWSISSALFDIYMEEAIERGLTPGIITSKTPDVTFESRPFQIIESDDYMLQLCVCRTNK